MKRSTFEQLKVCYVANYINAWLLSLILQRTYVIRSGIALASVTLNMFLKLKPLTLKSE